MLVEEFKAWLKEHTRLSQNSINEYTKIISLFLKKYKTISEESITKFLFDKKRSYNRKFAIKYFLKFLGKDEMNEKLRPIYQQIKLPKQARYDKEIPDFEEFKILLNQLTPQLKVLLMVMYDTGCRVGALLGLRKKDVKFDKVEKKYYIEMLEKGEKRIKRYLEDLTAKLLLEIIEGLKNDDFVFKEKGEGYWKAYYRYWTELKNKSRKIFGVGISFHWLRTTRGRELYRKYKDLLLVKQFLAHESIQTTVRYIEPGKFESLKIIKGESKW